MQIPSRSSVIAPEFSIGAMQVELLRPLDGLPADALNPRETIGISCISMWRLWAVLKVARRLISGQFYLFVDCIKRSKDAKPPSSNRIVAWRFGEPLCWWSTRWACAITNRPYVLQNREIISESFNAEILFGHSINSEFQIHESAGPFAASEKPAACLLIQRMDFIFPFLISFISVLWTFRRLQIACLRVNFFRLIFRCVFANAYRTREKVQVLHCWQLHCNLQTKTRNFLSNTHFRFDLTRANVWRASGRERFGEINLLWRCRFSIELSALWIIAFSSSFALHLRPSKWMNWKNKKKKWSF